MDARPSRWVVLCLTKHLAGYWRDIPVTTENIADHIQDGIAFSPTEVSMWHSSGSIAQIQQKCGYPVCHSRAFRSQHLMGILPLDRTRAGLPKTHSHQERRSPKITHDLLVESRCL